VSLFKNIDCIQLYVSDLEEGLKYYKDGMGLKLIWKTDTSAGLGMQEGVTEIVLQKERKNIEVDIRVESVEESIIKIAEAGGNILYGSFDIPIGKCAVIRDKWNNQYAILDTSKGRYLTDSNGNVLDVK
jgi:predicted enzyme related to lactoylglutathione lyase